MKRRTHAGGGDTFKVHVRVKPLTPEDLAKSKGQNNPDVLGIVDQDGKKVLTLSAGNNKEARFSDFDGVLVDATNQEVFRDVCEGPLQHVLGGTNASVMAYGQTGSGKTHTMFGSRGSGSQTAKDYGILQLALHHVDRGLGFASRRVGVSVSVFEVYNEEVFTLLDVRGVGKSLLRNMLDYNAVKPKLMPTVEEAVELTAQALALRTQDATSRNTTSSRSHAVVKIRVEQPPGMVPTRPEGVAATLFLVDLAGSEGISSSATRSQQKETISINTSLNALERVMNSLEQAAKHVPFRDSRLTGVLQEGLDPSRTRVALIATVSRFHSDLAITKSTLSFAMRARNVRTFAQVNAAPKREVAMGEDLKRQLQQMEASNFSLRQQLQNLQVEVEQNKSGSTQVKAMKDELYRMEETQGQLQRTCVAQERELEELRLERDELLARLAALQSELDALSKDNEQLSGQLWVAQAEAAKTGELAAALARLEAEAAGLRGELAGAVSRAEQLQGLVDRAQEELAEAQQLVARLKGQLAGVEAGAVERSREAEEREAELRSARDAAAREVAALRQQLAEAVSAKEEAVKAAAEAEQQLKAEEESGQGTRQQVADLLAQLREEQQQAESVEALRAELQEARQQVRGLEAATEEGSGEQQRLQAALRTAEAAAEELKAQLEAAEEQLADRDDEVNVLQGRVQALEASSRQEADGAARLGAELQAVRDQAADREQRVEELAARAAAAEAASKQEAEAAAQLQQRLEAAKADAEAQREQAASLAARVASLEEAGTREAVSVAELRQQLASSQASVGKVQQDVAAAEGRAGAAAAEAAALRTQLAEQAAAHAAAVVAAVQAERHAGEGALAAKLVPLQTEYERLSRTAKLNEEQMGRLQAQRDGLAAQAEAAASQLQAALAEAAAARRDKEAAEAAAKEAAKRAAVLETQLASDVVPRKDVRQMEEKVKLLEAQLKQDAVQHKGELELKDKLIHKLQVMQQHQQSELDRLKMDTQAPTASDQHAPYGGGSPFAATESGCGSGMYGSPGPYGDDGTPVSGTGRAANRGSGTTPPAFLSRTTTQGAAALRRNNPKPGAPRPLGDALSTPPPVPRSGSLVGGGGAGSGADVATPAPAGYDAATPCMPDVSPLDEEALALMTQRRMNEAPFATRVTLGRGN